MVHIQLVTFENFHLFSSGRFSLSANLSAVQIVFFLSQQSAVFSLSGPDASTEDKVGGPPGFGPAEPIVGADMFSTSPRDDHMVDVSDNSATRRL